MQNLFISPEDEFIIKFCVAIDKDDTIFCDIEKKSLVSSLEAMGKEVSDFSIEEYNATFKKPSFGDTMTMYNEIFSVNGDTGVNFNPVVARYNKIIALMKSWNLKGEPAKPSEEEVRQLHPVIANAIGIQIDFEVGGILS
jgi:hypothetical protein